MSGHSKWANIRLRKGAQDIKKAARYGKLSREIIVAAREGGGNPDSNSRLKTAVDKARAMGLPQDNIKRAIQRGTGEIEVKSLTEEDELKLIDLGAKDFEENVILTETADLKNVVQKIREMGIEVTEERMTMRAKQPVRLKSETELERVMEMIGELEENDDVINVFAGFDYDE